MRLPEPMAFGGRKVWGSGFGIPLVIRYVLETCSSTDEACDVLKRIPVHMGYIVTVVDKSGKYAINPQFDEAAAFADGLARVKVSRKTGYVNPDGKYVWNPTN